MEVATAGSVFVSELLCSVDRVGRRAAGQRLLEVTNDATGLDPKQRRMMKYLTAVLVAAILSVMIDFLKNLSAQTVAATMVLRGYVENLFDNRQRHGWERIFAVFDPTTSRSF